MLNPATHALQAFQGAAHTPLNEGRDVKPGDTVGGAGAGVQGADRSTKAGMLNPATHGRWAMDTDELRRSTKAGMLNPATPAPPVWLYSPTLIAQRRPGC